MPRSCPRLLGKKRDRGVARETACLSTACALMLTNGSYHIKTHFIAFRSDKDAYPLLLKSWHGNYLAKDLIRPPCSVSTDMCMGFIKCYIDGIFESEFFIRLKTPATSRVQLEAGTFGEKTQQCDFSNLLPKIYKITMYKMF